MENVTENHFRFSLLDTSGRLVSEASFTGKTFLFNKGSLPAGIYFFRIHTSEKVIATGKVVLQ